MGQKQQRPLRLEPEQVERPTVNQPLRFYRLPVSKRFIMIRTTYTTLPAMLVEIDDGGKPYGLFVYYCFGFRPTEYEIKQYLHEHPISETNYYVYVEGQTAEDALANFHLRHPETSKTADPAIRLDRRRAYTIQAMPPCNAMIREKSGIFCQTRLNQNIDKNDCRCFVEHGWPPNDCPIAREVKFEFHDPPLPYANEAPF